MSQNITSVELKKLLKERFPKVKFSVTASGKPYCNFIRIEWDTKDVPLEEMRAFTDPYDDETDPFADGVTLGQQSIHLRPKR